MSAAQALSFCWPVAHLTLGWFLGYGVGALPFGAMSDNLCALFGVALQELFQGTSFALFFVAFWEMLFFIWLMVFQLFESLLWCVG